jgi:hypothetical protein
LVEKLLPDFQTKALVLGSVGLLQSSKYKKANKKKIFFMPTSPEKLEFKERTI